MKVIIRCWVFLACIVIILPIVDCDNLSIAGVRNRKKPNVYSVNFKGERENKFKTDESIYVNGCNFEPLTNVDIYVTNNRKWVEGDPLTGTDVSTDGVKIVQTTSKGNIPKTMVWGAPTLQGKYDIVVDANRDGIFNDGDAVDGKSAEPGVKVKRFSP